MTQADLELAQPLAVEYNSLQYRPKSSERSQAGVCDGHWNAGFRD